MRSVLSIALVAGCATPLIARAEPSSCETCHDEAMKRAGHGVLLKAHAGQDCVSCHGGDASEKDATKAHAATGAKALLAKAHIAASCARCHLPGAVAGTELLVSGARTYQDLGCPFCHNVAGYGSTEKWALPLTQVGLRGPDYLRKMLNTPFEIFPGTRMPSFTVKWKHTPERETALLTYLLTLRGEPTAKARVSAAEACSSCHSNEGTKKDRIANHRCPELAEPQKELSCQRCHPKGVPVSDRECLYVRQRRFDCGVCHLGEEHGSKTP